MIDTHSHINTDKYDGRIDEIVTNAKNEGVNYIFAVGMDYPTSKRAIELANEYNNIFATVGIHPSYVTDLHTDLDNLYSNKKVIAVGEIGIDLYWTKDNLELQERVFEEQIQKAIKLDLPIIVHTRDSFDECYNIVKKYKGLVKGVFHCFSSSLEDALKIIELGFLIGVDGPLTFKNNEPIATIIKEVDLKHILIETDSPYLTPVPYRGKENQPAYVKYVAIKVAEIKNITVEEVIEVTSSNAIKLFKLEEYVNEK